MNEIKQFKLTNGEEIVCDVIEWPDVDGDSPDVVIKNAYKIIVANVAAERNMRYYTFAPWLVYQDDDDLYQVLNSNHIIAEANPTQKLLEQYLKITEVDNITQEEVDQKINDYAAELRNIFTNMHNNDSDVANIISFPGRGRLN